MCLFTFRSRAYSIRVARQGARDFRQVFVFFALHTPVLQIKLGGDGHTLALVRHTCPLKGSFQIFLNVNLKNYSSYLPLRTPCQTWIGGVWWLIKLFEKRLVTESQHYQHTITNLCKAQGPPTSFTK